MDESYSSNLPTSRLLGSVPAVINDEKKTANYEAPEAKMQIPPPNNGRGNSRGYQNLGSPSGAFCGASQGCKALERRWTKVELNPI
ncbi:uncharacterized protein LOC110817028 isoform X2 [Carica papaya]|uniref:uncharacterized protein LOC110817028 isoform X2 n=1 Tax=Carica papaya TaxID=3649 RepID=UPI000B8CD64C|nr:uncharacterized protein LOC110817028 isoform X2 [Carica papaya]